MNGIQTKHIFLTNTSKSLPHVVFKNLEIIENFNFNTIDSFNVKKFLNERVLIQKEKDNEKQIIDSDLIFDNITVNGEIQL